MMIMTEFQFISFYLYVGVYGLIYGRTVGNHTFLGIDQLKFRQEDENSILAKAKDRLEISAIVPVEGNINSCQKRAKCYNHNHTTCLGVKLPYSHTSVDILGESLEPHQVMEDLQKWKILSNVPKCWAAVQPFLCAVYMPKCDPEKNLIDLPSQEMCKLTMSPCKILYDTIGSWPPFFNCDDIQKFPPLCKYDIRELKFNTTGQCLHPLIQTDNAASFYEGIEGCGTKCQNPLLTDDEHNQIHKTVAICASVSLFFNFFTVISFFIDWRSGNKYPALIIFYINLCFLLSNIGWLTQFIPGTREDIVCRKDGTRRLSAPSAGENLSCVINFILIYYFLMAACVWFVILTYAWHLSFRALGKIQERIDKKRAYFHLVAWSLPLVLTITTMASGQIDGDSVAGVCFVGYSSYFARASLVLLPVAAMVFVGGFFLIRGLTTLIHIKIGSQEIISEKASAKIQETIIKIILFSLLCLIFVIATFVCHIYEFRHGSEWEKSLRKYIICRITASDPDDCKLTSRPSFAMIQLHLLILFGAGIVMSFWVWTSSTVDTWKRFIKRMFNKESQEPLKVKKHKVIAQAFAKRKELNNDGKVSISIHNTHTDPVGLNFELNSAESQDLSSTWAAALPKLVTRRGALIDMTTESNSSKRRNSYDSEISYSLRRVSVESRRHSVDSQVSYQFSEITATRKTTATPRPGGVGSRSRGKRRRGRDFTRSRKHQNVNRRGSSTSQESQLGVQLLSAITMGNSTILPNLLKRRTGNAGLDVGDPLGGKLSLPFDLSDDYNSNGDEFGIAPGATDDDQTNGSDDELCAPGEGIQSLDGRESDGAERTKAKRSSNFSKNLPKLKSIDYEDDDTKIEKLLNRNRGCEKSTRLLKNKLQIKDSDFESFNKSDRRSKHSRSEYYKSSRSSKSRRYSREHDVERKNCRSKKESDSELQEITSKRKNSDEVDRRKHGENGNSVNLNRSLRNDTCNRTDDHKLSEFDSDGEETHQMQSIGTQIDVRSGSSRSKRSVDVGTQISAREIATQTDPHDYNGTAQCSTSTQGTQMTPPYHIRFINHTLGGRGNATTARGGNYSYSALSLTDPCSESQSNFQELVR